MTSALQFIDHPSPNYDERGGVPIEKLVLHYTGMKSGAEAIARLCDPAAKVSAHYVVEEDGRIFRLVDESKRAWHAGVSYWRGCRDLNAHSIGIEMVNPGHEFGYRDFPEPQMQSVMALCHDILSRYPIPSRSVVGHSDIAYERKADPGERFDWERMAKAGIGLWHDNPAPRSPFTPLKRGDGGEGVRQMQEMLLFYGYEVLVDGLYGEQAEQCSTAFQRHFRPSLVNGIWDGECASRLAALIKKIA